MPESLVPDELVPEEFEEKDMKSRRPFEVEKVPFSDEWSVFLPVVVADIPGMQKARSKFSKRIFASEEDARKEIKKYLTN